MSTLEQMAIAAAAVAAVTAPQGASSLFMRARIGQLHYQGTGFSGPLGVENNPCPTSSKSTVYSSSWSVDLSSAKWETYEILMEDEFYPYEFAERSHYKRRSLEQMHAEIAED